MSLANYSGHESGRACFDAENRFQHTAPFVWHNAVAPSKKGGAGIGVPPDHCDESRSFCSAEQAAFLSVPPFMVARTGELRLRQLTQVVTGTPTRSSYRPRLALGAVVVAKLTTWRPSMAAAHTRPDTSGASARSHVSPAAPGPDTECLAELLHGCTAECAHTVASLHGLVQLLQGCKPGHTLSAGGLLALLEPLAGSLDSLCNDLHTAHSLFPQHPHH